jgi:hypothetical protein
MAITEEHRHPITLLHPQTEKKMAQTVDPAVEFPV